MADKNSINIHFAHANGFPSGSYQKVFDALPENFQVNSLDKFGHDARYPVAANWRHQVAELVNYLEMHHQQPVYAVGHSFGGVLSYMAACERPDLFKGLIMLDPPIVTGVARILFKLAKFTPLINHFTPAKLASTRCTKWHGDADMVAYFKQKNLFKNMHPDCIVDYVKHATARRGGHIHLTFDANVEAAIFRNIPDHIQSFYGKLKCPALLLTAEKSVMQPAWIKAFLRANQVEHKVLAGVGHMFPLEKPQQVAEHINYQIQLWQADLLSAQA